MEWCTLEARRVAEDAGVAKVGADRDICRRFDHGAGGSHLLLGDYEGSGFDGSEAATTVAPFIMSGIFLLATIERDILPFWKTSRR